MRILLLRLSALGDIVHSLPAVTDLRRALPNAVIDLGVDERFVDLAQMQSHADHVISFPIKRWRGTWTKRSTWQELKKTLINYRSTHYDLVIDVHGVSKSSIVAWLARSSLISGPDAHYSVGWLPKRIYQQTCHPPSWTPRTQWVRHIVAQALGRSVQGPADFGLKLQWCGQRSETAALVINTAGAQRLWDDAQWIELGRLLAQRAMTILLPWGNASERERVLRVIDAIGAEHCQLGATQSIKDWAQSLSQVRIVVGVDTGLLHIAAAVGVPCVGIFTSSDPRLLISQRQEWVRTLGGPGQPRASAGLALTAVQELLTASA